MKTKNLLIFFISFLFFTFGVHAQRGVKIGYIDMEYILESVPEYREAQTQLEGKVQRWKKDIEKMQNEVDQMKLDLANERVLLTKELIDEREEEIQIKEDEIIAYQQNRFGPQGDLIIQRRQLVQPIQDQVFNIIQEIAENRKYDFIFDKSADVVMLFAAKRNDISDVVLRSIERAGRRVQANTRKEQREIEMEERKAGKEENEALNERQKEIEERRQEREKEIEQKQKERENTIEARRRERDSIREQKQREFEERRQRMIEERQRRQDSIKNARQRN